MKLVLMPYETKLNRNPVIINISRPSAIFIPHHDVGVMTWVKSERIKIVAFGLSKLTKNPSFTYPNGVLGTLCIATMSCDVVFFALNNWYDK